MSSIGQRRPRIVPDRLSRDVDLAAVAMQRYLGCAIGKGQRGAKTEIEKLKFAEKTVEEALGLVAKILHTVHDDAKDKPMEVELSWLCAATGWRHEPVPRERKEAAVKWAKDQIEAEEMGDDEDDED